MYDNFNNPKSTFRVYADEGSECRNFAPRITSLYKIMIELNLSNFQYEMESLSHTIDTIARDWWDNEVDPETAIRTWEAFVALAEMCRGEGETPEEHDTRPYLPKTKERALEIGNSHAAWITHYRWEQAMEKEDPVSWEHYKTHSAILGPPTSFGQVFRYDWDKLKTGFDTDLKSIFLFELEREEVEYYKADGQNTFDSPTTAKFGIKEDTDEAAKCFALERYTACVFHTMRAMERIVQVLASRYLDKQKEETEKEHWEKLLRQIRVKLGDHTTKAATPEDARMREICISLDSIRGIWRNPVAHPRHNYTKEESRSIFGLSREVAKQIAALI